MKTLVHNVHILTDNALVTFGDFSFSMVDKMIPTIENQLVSRVIGPEQYKELVNYLHNKNSGSGSGSNSGSGISVNEKYDQAIADFQYVVSNIAIAKIVNIGSLQFSNSGINIHESDTMKIPAGWRLENLRTDLSNEAFDRLDVVLEYMEENAEDFEEWKDSEYFTNPRGLFVYRKKFVEETFSIGNSSLIFASLLAQLKNVQMWQIHGLLGAELYERLIKVNKGTATEVKTEENMLIHFLRSAIVWGAIVRAAKSGGAMLTDNGFAFRSLVSSTGKEVSGVDVKPIENNPALLSLLQNAEESYAEAVGVVQKYLSENAAKFPQYKKPEQSMNDNQGKAIFSITT
jgi:hypothetical protein